MTSMGTFFSTDKMNSSVTPADNELQLFSPMLVFFTHIYNFHQGFAYETIKIKMFVNEPLAEKPVINYPLPIKPTTYFAIYPFSIKQ